MAKDYNAINFKNKDIDKFAGKFGQGDPVKSQSSGRPEYLKGEHGTGPYSVGMQQVDTSNPRMKNYGPKKGWNYVDAGTLSKQDSLDINANRAPSMKQLEIVSSGQSKGVKFPGLSKEFQTALDTYKKTPAKYK